MKNFPYYKNFAAALMLIMLFCGCSSSPFARHPGRFFQKSPVKVAIIPASNKTDEASAPMYMDAAWEKVLTKLGFEVVNADKVVTYASSQGINLVDFYKLKITDAAGLGNDLGVDYVLFNVIHQWQSNYKVLISESFVTCHSVLYEAKTGSTVWQDTWFNKSGTSSSGNPLMDVVSALVHSTVAAMDNEEANLAENGVAAITAAAMPYPGYAPNTNKKEIR